MIEGQRETRTEQEAVSGQSARRRFLKTSGTVAAAAPAAILLLSATRANAQVVPYTMPPQDTSIPR